MHNCIFTAHCIEGYCDRSCPILVETSYLLERNGIPMTSSVFQAPDAAVNQMLQILERFNQSTGTVIVKSNNWDTVKVAELLTYCAICQNWKGSKLHCTVYNLKYSKYLDEIRKSWSMKVEPESLEYMRIWTESAKVLIVSNFDYVNFKDYEAQTLLNLIQTRMSNGLTTILVSPDPDQLVSGSHSPFLQTLKTQWMNRNTTVEFPKGGVGTW